MKKIDVQNFFYSIGAVIILLGVIAKFLEWRSQEILLLTGLATEAFVFIISSIQKKVEEKKYQWENVFPELLSNEKLNIDLQESIKAAADMHAEYLKTTEKTLLGFASFNENLEKILHEHTATLNSTSELLNISRSNIEKLNEAFLYVNQSMDNFKILDQNILYFNNVTKDTSEVMSISKGTLISINSTLEDFNSNVSSLNNVSQNMLSGIKQSVNS